MVARAAARSHGQRQADGIGVESQSTGNQDASPGALGRSPVGARQEACRGASVPTRAAPSCRPGRHSAAGELPARTDRDRPRSFRRPSIGHPLRHTRCADLSDLNPGRDRRGARTQDARGSLAISVSHLETRWDIQLELPLGLELAHELGHLVLHNAIFTKGDGSSDDPLKWVSGATTWSRRKPMTGYKIRLMTLIDEFTRKQASDG